MESFLNANVPFGNFSSQDSSSSMVFPSFPVTDKLPFFSASYAYDDVPTLVTSMTAARNTASKRFLKCFIHISSLYLDFFYYPILFYTIKILCCLVFFIKSPHVTQMGIFCKQIDNSINFSYTK